MLPLLADPLFSPLLVSKSCSILQKIFVLLKVLKTKHEDQLHVFLR